MHLKFLLTLAFLMAVMTVSAEKAYLFGRRGDTGLVIDWPALVAEGAAIVISYMLVAIAAFILFGGLRMPKN